MLKINIKVNGISSDIVRRLDALAQEKRLSRNQLMIQILSAYCIYGDTFFMRTIPDTVRFALRDTVHEQKENDEAMLAAVIAIQNETVQTLRDMLTVFGFNYDETADF